jgi:hypothetical protein
MKPNETWSTKELVNFLTLSNEALRIENARLMDEIERLTNSIEVCDAVVVANCNTNKLYNFNYIINE